MTLSETQALHQLLLATFILGPICLLVVRDALRTGQKPGDAFLWGLGVFLVLVVYLPAYLYYRHRYVDKKSAIVSGRTCRYCGVALMGDPTYCPACSKQLRGAESVHGKPRN